MADKKISALTSATTPLAGTEVLPIVQGGTTVKVSAANITAGRDVTGNSFSATTKVSGQAPRGNPGTSGSATDYAVRAADNVGAITLDMGQSNAPSVNTAWMQVRNQGDYSLNYNLAIQPNGGVLQVGSMSNPVAGSTLTVFNGNIALGTAGKGITTSGATALGLGVNSSVTAVTINASSNVGIGTSSPASKFNVVGDQMIIGSADGTDVLGIQIKGTSIGAIPAAQVQGYIATGNSSIGIAGDLLIACRTDIPATVRIITGTTPTERLIVNGSGNVGIGTSSPDAAAILDVQSTTKGVRFPNMTTTQKNAITPAAGTVVFDTTLAKLCVYSGAAWQTITSV